MANDQLPPNEHPPKQVLQGKLVYPPMNIVVHPHIGRAGFELPHPSSPRGNAPDVVEK